MQIFIISFILLNLIDSLSPQNDYWNPYLEEKIYDISQSDGDVLFMFFTDTHISHNTGHSYNIINTIQRKIICPSIFWGGDAITAYSSDMEKEWEIQKHIFDTIALFSNVYAIRGNHDFTYKNKKTGSGKTLTQGEVSSRILNECTGTIVTDINNTSPCYYFVDDDRNKIRYIVFDTNDAGTYGDVPWGYKSSVGHEQLKWIATNAILTTPDNYGIIFFSHIPITHHFNAKFASVEKTIKAAAYKESVEIDGDIIDFRQMNHGTKVLLVLSGHNHHDMQIYTEGILQGITACDAFYNDYLYSPFASYCNKREKSSFREQVVDLCKYDNENNVFSFFRFGCGGDRFFHLTPIKMSVGDSIKLPSTLKMAKHFTAYDSDAKWRDKVWILNCDVVAIDDGGLITAKNIGESTVCAINAKGNIEFFDVIVK